jgi:hypothetical protein
MATPCMREAMLRRLSAKVVTGIMIKILAGFYG